MERELEQVLAHTAYEEAEHNARLCEEKEEEQGLAQYELEDPTDTAFDSSPSSRGEIKETDESGTDSSGEDDGRDAGEEEALIGSTSPRRLEEGIRLLGTGKLLRGDRKRMKPTKHVSWIDLEKGGETAVTQVFPADSPIVYDRRPAPMRREVKLLAAETKMDKLLVMIIIALIVVILISFGVFVILMVTGIIQKRDTGQ